jgi:hypothetical protein
LVLFLLRVLLQVAVVGLVGNEPTQLLAVVAVVQVQVVVAVLVGNESNQLLLLEAGVVAAAVALVVVVVQLHSYASLRTTAPKTRRTRAVAMLTSLYPPPPYPPHRRCTLRLSCSWIDRCNSWCGACSVSISIF